MWHLNGIILSVTYLAIMSEGAVAVCCILVDISKYVGSIWP